ncbi:hypothetical protein HU200_023616 [Digitaria exilis]|uniref:Uncharacterized protein n=1 Tax=Digitaria exilis TaxID=1010633 RepID=A0A835C5N7_9POAL|nr:hypothetical protein HU200_023616 [Digitaria exilis]
MLEEPVALPTPSKRRARKMKEPLDDKFLRRSKRLTQDLMGFKNAASRDEASTFPDNAGPAPHLTPDVVHGIATGFLHIQPVVVSSAILEEDVDNVES